VRAQRVRALVTKELKRMIREPANLFMALLFPLILTLAFGAAFGVIGTGGQDTQYDVGMVNLDGSPQPWVEFFKGNISANGILMVQEYSSREDAQSDLQQGKIDAFLVIPETFAESIESFMLNPQDPRIWVNSTIELGLDQGSMIVSAAIPPMIHQALSATLFGEQAMSITLPIEFGSPTMVEAESLTQFDYMVPGLFSYAAIFVTMIVAQAFSSEREQGLLRRIRVTPTSSSEVITSHIISNTIIGALQVIIVFTMAYLMGFRPHVSAGSLTLAMVMVLLLVLCNVGFGLITGSVVKSSGAATGLSFLFILPQMLLGTFVPAPKAVARIVPSHYVTDALTSLFLRGAPIESPVIVADLATITVFSIIAAFTGILIYGKFGSS
jgi:ABC-2 type transport system permease protein